nr:hypothetical protein [Nanoarchaeum sp.]
MFKKDVLLIICLLFVISEVYAIGISPGLRIVYFESNQIKNIEYSITNSRANPVIARVSLNGEYMALSDFEQFNVSLKPYETREYSFNINLPEDITLPGDHENYITAEELILNPSNPNAVGAAAGVIMPVIIRVPYNGTFLKAKIYAESSSVGQPVKFQITLENLGTDSIPNINGKINIYNSENKTVDTIDFLSALEISEIKQFEQYWDSTGNLADEYRADLVLNFNSKTVSAYNHFKLGDLFVDIIDYQKELNSGKINEYKSEIKSEWNQKINDVYVMLIINVGDVPISFKDKSFELMPFEQKNISSYIDGRNLAPGIYNATFKVSYDGYSNTENFELIVKKAFNYTTMIIAGGFVLLLVIIILLLMLLRKSKKGK